MVEKFVFLMAGPNGGKPGAGMDMTFFFLIILTFAILYFVLMRPQQKEQQRHAQMLKNLKKGDDVVTAGGIYGKIMDLDEQTVDLKIAEGTKVKVDRSRIGRVITESKQ